MFEILVSSFIRDEYSVHKGTSRYHNYTELVFLKSFIAFYNVRLLSTQLRASTL